MDFLMRISMESLRLPPFEALTASFLRGKKKPTLHGPDYMVLPSWLPESALCPTHIESILCKAETEY